MCKFREMQNEFYPGRSQKQPRYKFSVFVIAKESWQFVAGRAFQSLGASLQEALKPNWVFCMCFLSALAVLWQGCGNKRSKTPHHQLSAMYPHLDDARCSTVNITDNVALARNCWCCKKVFATVTSLKYQRHSTTVWQCICRRYISKVPADAAPLFDNVYLDHNVDGKCQMQKMTVMITAAWWSTVNITDNVALARNCWYCNRRYLPQVHL